MLEKLLNNIPSMAENVESLQLLRLRHWQSVTPITGLTGLRSLNLDFSPVTKSVSDVLSTLASVPHLTFLTVYCHASFLRGRREAAARKFSLPLLRRLDLHGNVKHMGPFVSNLSLPGLEYLKLVFGSESADDEYIPPAGFSLCLECLKLADARPPGAHYGRNLRGMPQA